MVAEEIDASAQSTGGDKPEASPQNGYKDLRPTSLEVENMVGIYQSV